MGYVPEREAPGRRPGQLCLSCRESRASIRLFLDNCPADILKLNEDELDVITRLFGFKMAGDSFTGAFIGAYLNGISIPQAHALAVQVSAYVCTQKGDMPVIPDDLIRDNTTLDDANI